MYKEGGGDSVIGTFCCAFGGGQDSGNSDTVRLFGGGVSQDPRFIPSLSNKGERGRGG